MTMHTPILPDLDRLAVDLEARDPAVGAEHLDALVDRARVLGIDAPSLVVLTDRTAPEVVRSRALALVTAHLRRLARTHPDATLAPDRPQRHAADRTDVGSTAPDLRHRVEGRPRHERHPWNIDSSATPACASRP